MKIRLLWVSILLIFTSCSAVKTIRYVTSLNKGSVQEGSFHKYDHFILKNNLAFVKVLIHGKEYTFLVDTGAPPTILSPFLVKQAGLKITSKGKTGDSQSNNNSTDLITLDSITIAGVNFYNAPCVQADLNEISKAICLRIDGIIGNSLMRKAIWTFDFQNNIFGIASDKSLTEPLANPRIIPFTTGKYDKTSMIDIVCKGNDYHGNVNFDMGSSGNLHFGKILLEKVGNNIKANHYSIGNSNLGLFGYGKIDTTFYATNKLVNIGSIKMDSLLISYKKTGPTTLGMEILKNHNFIIDWQKEEITFSKIGERDTKGINPLGFSYLFRDNDCVVTELYESSNAQVVEVE